MNTQPHILVIDDEPQILRALRTILSAQQYRVTTAPSGEEGLAQAAAIHPDIIILDLGLPDIDGFAVCRALREWTHIPIIILSVREDELNKVTALDQGADDYLVKPFSIEELLARIRVALRHSAQFFNFSKENVIAVGDLKIDLAAHIVTSRGVEVKLTATEFRLLAYLAKNTGRLLTHQNILLQIWGRGYEENIEYLRVYISQLRKKLEADPKNPQHLLSESGIGYRFSSGE